MKRLLDGGVDAAGETTPLSTENPSAQDEGDHVVGPCLLWHLRCHQRAE